MIVNSGNLRSLGVGFKTSFSAGMAMAAAQAAIIATTVPSTTATEEYGWLGSVPNVREWIGDRVIQNIATHDYAIKNKDWELTLGVERNHIEDDNLGIYAPLFAEMGRSTAAHRELLVYSLLKAGFTTKCYDGQYYFDTDHPVLNEAGDAMISVSNSGGGNGAAWFLVDDTRALKPIIFQARKPFNFVARDNPDDDNVFHKKQFVYGVDGRHNVGFGFWQFAYGSKDTLNAANYSAARTALGGMKGDHGRPLGITPKKLIVPPSLESAGRKLLNSENAAGGETNEWKGTAELVVVPWLA